MSGNFQTIKLETQKIKLLGKRPFESPKGSFHAYKAVLVGSFVFVPGFIDNNSPKNFVWAVLDIKRNQWRMLICPGAYLTREPIVHNDTVLHVGGGEEMPFPLTVCSLYDLVLKQWSPRKVQGMVPSSRCKFAGGLIESQDKYVVFGGRTRVGGGGVVKNDVHLLDVEKKVWIQPIVKGSQPRARHKHSCCVRFGAFYCYGGQDNQRRELQDGIFILHISTNNVARWSHPKTMVVGSMPPGAAKMIPFKDAFLLYGNTGLFKYDHTSRLFSAVLAGPESDFTALDYYSTAIALENDNEVGIFYGHWLPWYRRASPGYLRISA